MSGGAQVIRVGEPRQPDVVPVGAGGAPTPVYVPGNGTGGAVGQYVHYQDTPSDTWVVPHGLGRRPIAWSLYDDQDQECTGYVVEHPELNRAVVRMDVPTAGALYLI